MNHWMEVQGQTVHIEGLQSSGSVSPKTRCFSCSCSLSCHFQQFILPQLLVSPRSHGGLCVTSSSISRPDLGLSTPSLPPQLLLPTTASQGVSRFYQAFFPLYSLLMQFICLDISLHRHLFFLHSLHFRLYILGFDPLHQKIGYFEA